MRCIAHRLILNHAHIPLELVIESPMDDMVTFEQVVETNFVASARLLRYMLPRLSPKARVGIVASAGMHFFPGMYSACLSSKAAIVTFAKGHLSHFPF